MFIVNGDVHQANFYVLLFIELFIDIESTSCILHSINNLTKDICDYFILSKTKSLQGKKNIGAGKKIVKLKTN